MEAASLNQAVQNHPMHQDTTVKLSLCMIIRDEAAMLPEFLKRVRGLWDELVVVDTGSQDQTVAILEAAGAKVARDPDDFYLHYKLVEQARFWADQGGGWRNAQRRRPPLTARPTAPWATGRASWRS
jgi:glycosyltransferase involved in cell wall biosynthesis